MWHSGDEVTQKRDKRMQKVKLRKTAADPSGRHQYPRSDQGVKGEGEAALWRHTNRQENWGYCRSVGIDSNWIIRAQLSASRHSWTDFQTDWCQRWWLSQSVIDQNGVGDTRSRGRCGQGSDCSPGCEQRRKHNFGLIRVYRGIVNQEAKGL